MCKLFYLIVATSFIFCAQCVNILGIFDIPSRPMHKMGYKFLIRLADRGFNVTMLSAFYEKDVPNMKVIQIRTPSEYIKDNLQRYRMSSIETMRLQQEMVELAFGSEEIKHLKNSDTHFDLIIQHYAMNEAFLGFAYYFDAPVIAFVHVNGFPYLNDLSGNSAPYSYVPLPIVSYTDKMTFSERLTNAVAGSLHSWLHRLFIIPRQEEVLKENFPNAPPLRQLIEEKISVVFVNSHISTETPRPYVPNLIRIGGYSMEEPESLPSDFQQMLDDCVDGFVYLNFGSDLKIADLPLNVLLATTAKLERLQLKVLWKYKGRQASNQPKNVITREWFPQAAVLAHPNVKAFITHGGMTSMEEALYFGVPILCIPFYSDQRKSCKRAADLGLGTHILATEVTHEKFSDALDELIGNFTFAEAAKHRSILYRENPVKPMDEAVFWINHVLKYKGARHLKPKSSKLPLYQYLLVDVLAFLGAVSVAIFLLFYLCLKFLIGKLFRRKSANKIIVGFKNNTKGENYVKDKKTNKPKTD